ncbi:hypothetical protein Rhe02_13580 [Rhizocola hellebori]|uniref:Peptidase S1 domain-containing protein n=1 Tax=Rhizocola hellebori TaxID=1392758 RepID=A0A8J3Q4L8_9ACTN|nr:trypsin-like serine protease [Rhizocola hellebori]GIH03291.1 hypothetical protein Rhe02_13580 [Rhizocola hellebori]
MFKYRWISLATATTTLVAAGWIATGATGYAAAEEPRHQSGIALVGPADLHPARPAEAAAEAFSAAYQLALEHPQEFGYPWLDPKTGSVSVAVTGSAGSSMARQLATAAPAKVRQVSRSLGQLEQIKEEVTTLQDLRVPDAEAIFMAEPDGEHNRITITVDRLSDNLMAALAKRFGTEAIGVRVQTQRPRAGTDFGRDADDWPFWGGAQISTPVGTCTSGFPWVSGSTSYMITAGHCVRDGGNVHTPIAYVGTVTATTRENWSATTGTTLFPGETGYRGDVSLVEVTSGKTSGYSIYRGPAGSTSSGTVKEMWSRSPAYGDQYCTGGYRTGELCGWSVNGYNANIKYDKDGPNVWARNMIAGVKEGQCNIPGDSGSPVYTVRGDGGIAAKGIHSGTAGGGGDSWGGAFDPCYEYFTDIRVAWFYFPGGLRLG